MPTSSPRTASPTGFPTDRIDRRIAQARAVVGIERLLPRLWPAAGFWGFYLALALTGIFAVIAWPLQALLLAATITASGLSLADLLSQRIWSKIGAEYDAYFMVDSIGSESGGGGLNTTLRDLARFGEMIRNKGKVNGEQIIPAAAIAIRSAEV